MSEPVHYPGITSCGCPYIKQRCPSKHWKECHYRLNCERDAGEQGASQGGEAVEVVAYRGKDPDGGEGFVGARWPNAFGQECIVEPLMTVAQHQRILAAATTQADQVADGVVVSRKLLYRIKNVYAAGLTMDSEMDELRALLAKSEGVKK